MIDTLLIKDNLDRKEIASLLGVQSCDEVEKLRSRAEQILLQRCGAEVYYRGLIEFSNSCASDCLYCGIRRSNTAVNRYTLSTEQIITQAQWCASQGYGSLVLQSGERNDARFIDLIVDVVREIKKQTRSELLADGLGITLCVGEQTPETYQRFFDAGAHRYLLRIETSSPQLFAQWHPQQQKLESRVRCLESLKSIGFQVGTGVMIGVPGQTIDDLAGDICFFRDMEIDMIGMGPFIVHHQTPFASFQSECELHREQTVSLALRMIAVTRLVLKDVNIAATTALQALDPIGREKGLRHGANVIMPQLTPTEKRKDYLLYEGKPCLDETAGQCKNCLQERLESVNRTVGYNKWGDSRHWFKRTKKL
ncbi:MAG: [FeFe] hydrogenase H-cluster radical SAM maturase HydE [Chitinivibrionales bacterium]